MHTEKIAVSMTTAKIALQALQNEKASLEKRLREVSSEIREIKTAIETPIPTIEKKENDFTLTANRVYSVIAKHEGKSIADLAEVLLIDLNVQKTKESYKKMKNNIYPHINTLKKAGRIEAKHCKELAAYTYFPAAESYSLS